MKMEQTVFRKYRHIKFRRWGITQKKTYNIHDITSPNDAVLLSQQFLMFKKIIVLSSSKVNIYPWAA
jgi:hypothetical protein